MIARRLLVPSLASGDIVLPDAQAHHARDVLRMVEGDEVELFTADGTVAAAKLVSISPDGVIARVEAVQAASAGFELTIASAIPKAARGDWMIEKLSELGVARFVPLITERSVVHPEGKGKLERWQRIAAEAARQSRRTGVMRIEVLMRVEAFIEGQSSADGSDCAFLSTEPGRPGLGSILTPGRSACALLIGPEGGWSERELAMFEARHLTGLSLGTTILRVETAAIAAAAVVAALLAGRVDGRED